jgi:7-carboxy-7-deazaguanine synthase
VNPEIINHKSEILNQLPLMEDFYTIQGEGFYQGHAAYFIRLGGCDVGCVWCDVKESWNADAHPRVSVDEMVQRAKSSGTKLVVITGGEPAMYDLSVLTKSLQLAGLQTNIETSGCLSAERVPGTGFASLLKNSKLPIHPFFWQANELKVIVYNKSDFSWAEEFAEKVNSNCKFFCSPNGQRKKKCFP